MMRAAVPQYLGTDFSATPPGHRFGYLFSGWQDNWSKPDNPMGVFGKLTELLPVPTQKMTEGLCDRQQQLADQQTLRVVAKSIAPFVTGLGNEHPTENGFAFLNPYGIPYLPGSGVKGVMRSAACELLDGIDGAHPEWSMEIIDQLFGKDDDEEGNSGVLLFWDVIPKMYNHQMVVEIMNPHYGDYYQKDGTPNDSASPRPIFFLTVPPESEFVFHVQCRPGRLDGVLADQWQTMIRELFSYTFDWVGFGAKTSVGYGAMRVDEVAEQRLEEAIREKERALQRATLSEQQRQLEDLRKAFQQAVANGTFTAQGEVAQHRAELLKYAQEWESPEDRQAAHQLLSEMVKMLPWSKKKKGEYQQMMAALSSGV